MLVVSEVKCEPKKRDLFTPTLWKSVYAGDERTEAMSDCPLTAVALTLAKATNPAKACLVPFGVLK